MTHPLKDTCLHFRGDKPCRYKRVCDGCPHFSDIRGKTKILIVKCRAQGDVLRTTALLPGLKRKYPESVVTWLVDPESSELLEANPLVDRVQAFSPEGILPLAVERFDVLVSLDKEPGLTSLATRVPCRKKYGFGMNPEGNLTIFNKAAAQAFRLGVDDELKFRENTKSYQALAAEAVEIDYRRDEYVFALPEKARHRAEAFFRDKAVPAGRPNIGLNTGAGAKFLTKQWPPEHYAALIRGLKKNGDVNIFLLGGRREEELNRRIESLAGVPVFNTGNGHSLIEFSGFIDKLDVVVTSDSLGMHIAIALKKKVVALFGPTCPQEIDLYDRGVRLYRGLTCAPCYRQTCPDAKCMKDISPEDVCAEVGKLIRS